MNTKEFKIIAAIHGRDEAWAGVPIYDIFQAVKTGELTFDQFEEWYNSKSSENK